MFERVKEKIRQFRESDQWMKVQPMELLQQYTAALPRMTPEKRLESVDHLKWRADYFYSKPQKKENGVMAVKAVPGEVIKAVENYAFAANRMNAHDVARRVLEQHGSPEQALKSFIGQSDRTNKYFHEQGVYAGKISQSLGVDGEKVTEKSFNQLANGKLPRNEEKQEESIGQSIRG